MSERICGLTWNQIQNAQQKKPFREYVGVSKSIEPTLNAGDLDLLEEHGVEGLMFKEFYGILDRLYRCGVIPKQ